MAIPTPANIRAVRTSVRSWRMCGPDHFEQGVMSPGRQCPSATLQGGADSGGDRPSREFSCCSQIRTADGISQLVDEPVRRFSDVQLGEIGGRSKLFARSAGAGIASALDRTSYPAFALVSISRPDPEEAAWAASIVMNVQIPLP